MEELEDESKARLMVQFKVDGSQHRRIELFDLAEIEALLESLTTISEEQSRIFETELINTSLTPKAIAALREDQDISVNEVFRVESGWNYSSIFGMMAGIKQKIDILNTELEDDYFNQELEVGSSQTRLTWPESARYLRHKLTILESIHDAYLKEITDKSRSEFLIQFPGLSLLTQSHTTWIDSFESYLSAKKTSKEKYDSLVQMKAVLTGAIDEAKPKYREVDEVVTEYVPGIKVLPNEWYEITSNGIEKHSNHNPDLAAIVTWLERKILAAIPVFTIKQGNHRTPSLAKEALKRKWRELIVKKDLDISTLDDFINSNFRMPHQSDATRLAYKFIVTKEENIKSLILALREILEEFVVEESKAEKLLWLHVHVGESISYTSLWDYVYRSQK